MRTLCIIHVAMGFLLLASCSSEDDRKGQGAESQEALVEMIREAVREKDLDAIMALGLWDRIPDSSKNGMYRQIPNCFDYKEPKFSLREMSKKEREPAEAEGKTYVWNMEPLSYLKIAGSDAADGGLSIPIGIHHGRYYVASRRPQD